MRQPSELNLPGALRRGGIVTMLLALVLVLASCSGGRLLEGGDATFNTGGKALPTIALQQISGVPPARLTSLSSAVTVAASQRDIGLSGPAGLHDGQFTMIGHMQAQASNAGVRVVYQWQLRDTAGALVHTVEGHESAGLFVGTDAWDAVTPTVMDRIGRSTAESLAVRLAQLGYATRLARLDAPPPEYFVPAGQGAEREIDFATLDGPGADMAAFDGLGPEADVSQMAEAQAAPPATEAEAAAEPVPEQVQTAEKAPDTVSGKAEGKFEIKAVAVVAVKGAPGGGDAELTAAMRRTLAAAGWPVVSKPQADAITIVGKVRMSDARDGSQKVSVRWEVKTPAGNSLGDVKQANDVPAGALDAAWGDAAFAVAEAAAMGIFDIVKRYQ